MGKNFQGGIVEAGFGRYRRTLLVLVSLLLLIAFPTSGESQEVITIDGSLADPPGIELRPTVTLGDPADPEYFGDYIVLTRDSNGRSYVSNHDLTRVIVYGSDGRFARTVGRAGEGPGEFTNIHSLHVGSGDTLVVFDHAGKVIFFDSTGSFARQVQLPISLGPGVLLSDGMIAVARFVRTPDLVGYGVHIVDARGTRVRSVARVDAIEATRCATCIRRIVGRAGDPTRNRFWVARVNRYEFEVLTSAGETLGRWKVEGSRWFREWSSSEEKTGRSRDGSQRPFAPDLQKLAQDDQGRVWIRADAPSAEWEPLPPDWSGAVPVGETIPEEISERLRKNYATVIEVIDPEAGTLVASQRWTGRVIHMLSPTHAWEVVDDRSGIPRIQVYEMRIRSNRTERRER